MTVRRTRPLPVLLALAALSVACGDGSATDPDPMGPPPPGGWIYFLEDGVSAFDLRVRWVEGGTPVTLATGGDAFDPTWIPWRAHNSSRGLRIRARCARDTWV